jgi:hypothetical protein
VYVARIRFIALRTASPPTSSCARHCATIRGLIFRSWTSPKRGSTRFSQTRACWSTVSDWHRARASAAHTGPNSATVIVPSGSSSGGAGAKVDASSASRARSYSACSFDRHFSRSRRLHAS